MSAYCNNCGSVLPASARFCSVCGTVVSGFPPYGYAAPAPRLVRPLFGRQLAGVCVGLARTYGWDLGLVRVIAVVAGILTFPIAEVAYLACWIGIPEEQVSAPPMTQTQANPPQS